MSRPADWHPLAEHDPVPGDPTKVAAFASRYRKVAAKVRDAADNLVRIHDDGAGLRSEAVVAFRAKAGDVRTDLSRIQSRYQGLGDALATYAPKLDAAQELSVTALRAAQSAAQDQRNAEHAQHQAAQELTYAQDPVRQQELVGEVQQAQLRARQAETNLGAARALLAKAVAQRDEAARAARLAVDDTEATSAVRDTFLDVVTETVGNVALVVGDWTDAISDAIDKVGEVVANIALGVDVALLAMPWAAPVLGPLRTALTVGQAVIVELEAVVGTISTVAMAVRLVTGSERLTWNDVARSAVQTAADAAIGGLAVAARAKADASLVGRAQEKLTLSKKMSHVARAHKRPDALAKIWADKTFVANDFPELRNLLGSSTRYGQNAIVKYQLLDLGARVAIDKVKKGVGDVVDDAIGSVMGDASR